MLGPRSALTAAVLLLQPMAAAQGPAACSQDVTAHGAKGDGTADDSKAIVAAVAAAAANVPCAVSFPAGKVSQSAANRLNRVATAPFEIVTPTRHVKRRTTIMKWGVMACWRTHFVIVVRLFTWCVGAII